MKKSQLTIKRTPMAAAIAAAMLLTSAQSEEINITDRTEPIPTYSEIQHGGTEDGAIMDVFGNPYLRLTIAAESDGNKYEYAVSTAGSVDAKHISTIRLKAPDYISISADTSESAVNAVKGSTIELGNSEGSGANSVHISSTSDGLRAAYDAIPSFDADPDARITIQAKIIDITSKGSSIISNNNALVELNADRIEINSQGQDKASIVAHANSRIKLNANHIEIHSSSGTAIDVNQQTYASSVNNTEIVIGNENGDGVVIIDGDIFFNSGTSSKPLYIDVPISIAFNGPESSWTGNARLFYPTDANKPGSDEKYYSTSGLKISLSNGAQWTPTLINQSTSSVNDKEYTSESQAINYLTLSGGVINLNKGAKQVVEIEQLSGSGGVFNFEAEVDADHSTIKTGKIYIGEIDSNAAGTPHFDVNYTGITADDLTDIQEMKTLAENSVDIDGSASQTHVVEEGNLRGKVTLDISPDGTLSEVRTAPNMKLADLSSVNALNLVHWRSEINHLTKRMGDVRTSAAESGSWARVYGGESRWGDGSSVEMKRASVQVGGDARINSSWLLGGAFSYTDSDADLADGEAEGDAYGLAAYATYLADNGAYVDLIGRYGYLKSDVSTGNMSIDNASHAFGLSVEGGRQFRFVNNRGYVEPQVELTYGYVRGDDEVATNGVRIRQDDFQSLVARVGVRTGFDLPERAGTFYAALSYSYDFLGEAEAEASQNNLSADLREDLGGGWVSYGIGAQFRIGDNAFAYGELERTSGGKVDNPYLFNCGVRWNF